MTQAEKETWCREENPELYYKAREILNTDSKLARYLVQHSHRFVSFNSWTMFMSIHLFTPSSDVPTKDRYTMQQDFNKLIKEMLKNEQSK